MASGGKEVKVGEQMIDAFLNPRFAPIVLANHIKNLPNAEQQKFMDVMLEVFKSMAHDYMLGHYDNRNEIAARLAFEFYESAVAMGVISPL
jgi:hypothetical protein